MTELRQCVQHYGYRYAYRGGGSREPAPAFPRWASVMAGRLRPNFRGAFPVQCIVNEYRPGQGIGMHADHRDFGGVAVSLSLGTDWPMRFRPRASRPYAAGAMWYRPCRACEGSRRNRPEPSMFAQLADGALGTCRPPSGPALCSPVFADSPKVVQGNSVVRGNSCQFAHFCAIVIAVNGREFITRVRRLARKTGIAVRFDRTRGKGSHGTLY